MINVDYWTAVCKHHLNISQRVPKDFWRDSNVEVYLEPYVDSAVLTLSKKLYAYEHDKKEIKYPANWWEAFKERWLKFLKVKYVVYIIDYDIILPELKNPRFGDKLTVPYVSYTIEDVKL